MYKDSENNYWFTVRSKGVFRIPSIHFSVIDQQNGLNQSTVVEIIPTKKNEKILSSNNSFYVLNNNKVIKHTKLNFPENHTVERTYIDNFSNIIFSSSNGISVFDHNYEHKQTIPRPYIVVSNVDEQGNIWWGRERVIYNMQKTNNELYDTITSYKTAANFITMPSMSIQGDTIWLGTDKGLFTYNLADSTTYFWGDRNNALNVTIKDVKWIDQTVWAATHGRGLVALTPDSIYHFNSENHFLKGNICEKILISPLNNAVWVATNKGVTKLFNTNNITQLQATHYDVTDGLAADRTRDVLVDEEGMTWVTTSKGVTYFKEQDLIPDTVAPPIYLTGIKVWKKDTTLQKKYDLSYLNNDLTIDFKGISFKSPLTYRYQMEGWDSEWQTTPSSSVHYSRLLPGNYTFKVMAINGDHIQSRHPATFQLSIAPPFWQTWWFILSSLLALIGFISSLFWNRIRQIQEKNEIQKQLAGLELSGLRSQMNSHFLFNSLNAIQNFITQQDAESAHLYLSKFAKLIRQMLQKSKDDAISIHEEINGLKLYMDLEALRLSHRFSYTLHIDENIDQNNMKIPPMLVQPYIENAIRHGLRHQTKIGKLFVSFHLKENIIECIVEDNGIGRAKAATIKKHSFTNHKSMGTQITADRIKLLNQVTQKNLDVTIIDLENSQGEASGTKVVLTLPIIY